MIIKVLDWLLKCKPFTSRQGYQEVFFEIIRNCIVNALICNICGKVMSSVLSVCLLFCLFTGIARSHGTLKPKQQPNFSPHHMVTYPLPLDFFILVHLRTSPKLLKSVWKAFLLMFRSALQLAWSKRNKDFETHTVPKLWLQYFWYLKKASWKLGIRMWPRTQKHSMQSAKLIRSR